VVAPAAPNLHIDAFLTTLPARAVSNVTQIKAEEKAVAKALVADFPGQALPLSVMAAVHKSHGDVQRAEMLWKEALQIDPSESDFYEQLGLVAQEQDQLDRAIAYWQEGLKINPHAPSLRWRLAYVRVQQGQLDGTVQLLQEECRLTPDAARNYFLLGQVLLKQKAYQKAKACYEKALELQPSYANAHYGLGKVYTRLKQREKARASMEAYQMLKARQDASEEQRIILDELPPARIRAAGLYRRVAALYDSREHAPRIEQLLKRAIVLDPQGALNWERLATFHYQQDRFQPALASFLKAKELDPNNPLYYFNIGMLYGAMGQLSRAETSLKEAVDRFPQYGLAYAELARFYLYHRTNLAQAQSLAGKAIALQPSAAHYDLLARACEANGDRNAAVAAAEQALAMEPNNKRYRAFYAHLQSKR
jgi:superkiller protein 3